MSKEQVLKQVLDKLIDIQSDYQKEKERIIEGTINLRENLEKIEENRVYPNTDYEYKLEEWWEDYINTSLRVEDLSSDREYFSKKINEVIELLLEN